MTTIGTVDSLWRYPVKSMRGEQLAEAFVGFAGIYGDRMYAIHSTGQPDIFRWLTAREQPLMLLSQPAFRSPQAMLRPPNVEKAEVAGPGITPFYPLPDDTAAPSPEIIRVVSEQHGGNAGVYAVTLVEGIIHPGDTITLLD